MGITGRSLQELQERYYELQNAALEYPGRPEPLSGEYHRARRNLVVASSGLLAVTLLGLRVQEAEKAATFFGINVAIDSPGGLPYALAGLVVFFEMRLALEWSQCEPNRRNQTACTLDLALGAAIGVVALATFGLQVATGRLAFSDAPTLVFLIAASLLVAWTLIRLFVLRSLSRYAETRLNDLHKEYARHLVESDAKQSVGKKRAEWEKYRHSLRITVWWQVWHVPLVPKG